MRQPQTEPRLVHSPATVPAGLQQRQSDVSSGQLTIKQGAGEQLAQALSVAMDGAQQLYGQVQQVSTPASLGTNAVSAAMPGEFAGRANGDANALGQLLSQYQDILGQAHAAVMSCLSKYDATDGSVSSDLHPR